MTDTGRSDTLSPLESLPLSLLESHWQQALGDDRRAAYVRVVKIRGSMDGTGAAQAKTKKTNLQDDEGEDCEYEFEGGECKPPNGLIPFRMGSGRPTEDEKKIKNDAWKPLVALVRTLSGLQDLVYASTDQIPKCLLSALQEDFRAARLHRHTFNLRSLIHPEHEQQPIDEDELMLATSPCLYSVVAASAMYDASGNVDYNHEAVLRLVRGLAPRLVQMRFWYMDPGPSFAAEQAHQTPRPPWQGFHADGHGAQQSRGHLQSLFLGGNTVTPNVLETWSLHTDFCQLRSLNLDCCISLGALLKLGHMASAGELEAVRFLTLKVIADIHRERPKMDQAMGEVLQAMHCLESLRLSGCIGDRSMDAILKQHVEGLRQLAFVPIQRGSEDAYFAFSLRQALELSRRGHSLETLKMTVSRQGSPEEAAIYQALGRLPRLKSLALILDCPVERPRPSDDELDELDDVLWLGDGLMTLSSLRETFMNAAVDADLALQIFRLVSAHNSLRTLKLHPSDWPSFSEGSIDQWVRWLGRRWEVSTHDGKVVINEADIQERVEAGLAIDDTRGFATRLRRQLKKIWLGLWPQKTEQWWDAWSSFPLTTASTEGYDSLDPEQDST